MREKWGCEKAWDWYNSKKWIVGCNYIPSDCISYLEIWQEYEFDKKLETMNRELKLAADTGMNSVRMFFPFQVWKYQRKGFLERIETFLDMAQKYGITMMAVFFDDCCGPKEHYGKATFGKQPDPTPGYHGGFPPAKFNEEPSIGYQVMDVEEEEENILEYVRDIVSKFKDDQRIIMWDILNEPGNSNRGSKSMKKMEAVFELIRSINPIQPLTADAWSFPDGKLNFKNDIMEIEKRALELSDVITYHFYGDYDNSVKVIEQLKKYNRPMIITEWLHRPFGNNVETHLPLFKREKIGCYNWGLVAGKTQTYEPWESIRNIPGLDLSKWQHDLFHADLSPYDQKEIDIFKKLTLDR
ncbi:cellulase family glycosylhydrolase [Pseudoclostridium thermosuccinogenes]|jgi:hypothetical protein|uniref:cellulase family glycosylhydrolase n=1 Tax=Clostridium thermosuccinogenes TaxID=84032 RepID=UPI000CCC562D|nr:cellulase family glycosylhydrolase [Pseudoclostridium thermosuccinogenes]PNT92402.1 hypothetical protein CDQ83_02150 [Pseudoclostridium thermosuccinogenes]